LVQTARNSQGQRFHQRYLEALLDPYCPTGAVSSPLSTSFPPTDSNAASAQDAYPHAHPSSTP